MKVLSLKTGVTTESDFDYLVVATSHFSVPHVPTFEGRCDDFKNFKNVCEHLKILYVDLI